MHHGSILAAVMALVALPAAAGTRFALDSRDLRVERPRVQSSVLWLQGARLRLEADETSSIIYRADEDAAWVIDHRAKSYRSIDRESAETVARGVGQANVSARRAIESLPPEQRRAAERLLDRALGEPVAVSPDLTLHVRSEREEIAGISCVLYEVRRGVRRLAEVCRSGFEAARVSGGSRKAVRALTDSLGVVIPSLAPEALRQDGVDAVRAFRELDGVPLRVRLFEEGIARWELRVVGVEERAAPPAAFELPDGYERNLSLGAAGRAPSE